MADDPLEIPAFLRLTAEERKAAWAGHKVRPAPRQVEQDKLRKAHLKQKKLEQKLRLAELRERKKLEGK